MSAWGKAVLIAVTATAVVGSSTGCTAGPPAAPVTVTVTVTATTVPEQPSPIGAEQLESLMAPAMCEREAGRLVDGELPIDDSEGMTALATGDDHDYLWAQSTDPQGVPSLAVAFVCDRGGVAWPEVIGFYGRHGDLLASFDLGRSDGTEHSAVTSIRYRGGVFHVDWRSYDGAQFGPCNKDRPDDHSADFSLSEGQVVMTDFDAPCSTGD